MNKLCCRPENKGIYQNAWQARKTSSKVINVDLHCFSFIDPLVTLENFSTLTYVCVRVHKPFELVGKWRLVLFLIVMMSIHFSEFSLLSQEQTVQKLILKVDPNHDPPPKITFYMSPKKSCWSGWKCAHKIILKNTELYQLRVRKMCKTRGLYWTKMWKLLKKNYIYVV